MSHKGKNREPGTTQFWNGSSWVASGAYPEIYVDLTGDDSNSGLTIGDPVRTIKVALQIARQSSVPSEIFIGAGSFDATGLEDPRLLAPEVSITGSEFEELSGDLTVSAYNSSTRIITFSPSPGWVTNSQVGKLAQWQSGPSGPFPDALSASALISQNTADSLTVTYPPSIASPPVASDVFKIVQPATRITGALSVVGPPGAVANGEIVPIRLQPVYRKLSNLLFEGASSDNLVFDGSFRLEAVAAYDYGQIYLSGSCFAGDGETRNGRGLTALGTVRNPETRCTAGRCVMYLVGGRFIADIGGTAQWQGGFLEDTDASFPHGVLVSLGGQMLTFSQTIAGRLLINAGAMTSVVAEGGSIYVNSPITHQGSGIFMRTRDSGKGAIGRNPVIAGSNANILAEMGGQIRINGVDGSTLGDALAGISVALGQVTRDAAPWVAGDSVCGAADIPRDLSNIYRTP